MRISNFLAAVCATALVWGGLATEAQDNPNQAAARAALVSKLGELNAQPSPPPDQTMAPTNPPAHKQMTTAAPAPAATQTVPTPAGANDTPAQAAARAALMQRMGELTAQQPPPANSSLAPIVMKPSGAAAERPQPPAQPAKATAVSPSPIAPKPVKAKPAPTTASVPSSGNSGLFSPVPPPSNPQIPAGALPVTTSPPPATIPAAPPAVAGTPPPPAKPVVSVTPAPEKPVVPVAVPATKPAPPVVPPAVPVVKPAPANTSYPGKTLGFKPIDAPPPPVSAQKQAELQALLARYMANQVSPDEYQKERAAIMDEP